MSAPESSDNTPRIPERYSAISSGFLNTFSKRKHTAGFPLSCIPGPERMPVISETLTYTEFLPIIKDFKSLTNCLFHEI